VTRSRECRINLGFVVGFDQRVEAELFRQGGQFRQQGWAKGGHDQQDGIGAHQPGVAEVGRPDREVLPKHGNVGGGPGLGQVVG